FFGRLEIFSSEKVVVLVALEVGESYNDLIRVKRRCNLGDAVAELANEEVFFVLETCNLPLDGSREFGIIQLLVPEQCQRMHLDVIIDDEFLSRETHTFVRQM